MPPSAIGVAKEAITNEMQGEAGGGKVWPPGVPQPEVAGVDEDGPDKQLTNKTLLDTGCTKTLVHPWCTTKEDYLGWDIPYQTASSKQIYFLLRV